MSLTCNETDKYLDYGSPLYVATRWSDNSTGQHSAISDEVLKRIPESERRPVKCEQFDPGLDIHEGSTGRNFPGVLDTYKLTDFRLGSFLFSISAETAKKYLPVSYRMYNKKLDPTF